VKHVVTDRQAVERVLTWLGNATLQTDQWDQLENLASWLGDEAIRAGGLGPHESERIWSRHLADALTFAFGWRETGPPPRLIDIGAGVGLPGIPLAILWPATHVTLLDRASRRVDLARRAVRRLRLDNVEVRRGDAHREQRVWEGAVLRAVFPPEQACRVSDAVLKKTGIAVMGLRGTDKNVPPATIAMTGRSVRLLDVPATVLDGSVSLLIMGPQ